MRVACRGSEDDCRTMENASDRAAATNAERPVLQGNARLASPWYLAQRCQSECDNEDNASFAVLIVQPAEDTAMDDAQIVDVLTGGLRRADVVAELGTGRFAVLLSGAGGYDAGRVASRIRLSLPHVEIGIAVFSQDGANLGELVSSALDKIIIKRQMFARGKWTLSEAA